MPMLDGQAITGLHYNELVFKKCPMFGLVHFVPIRRITTLSKFCRPCHISKTNTTIANEIVRETKRTKRTRLLFYAVRISKISLDLY